MVAERLRGANTLINRFFPQIRPETVDIAPPYWLRFTSRLPPAYATAWVSRRSPAGERADVTRWIGPVRQLVPRIPLLDDQSIGVEDEDRCAGE
jgi:hypothetical protein